LIRRDRHTTCTRGVKGRNEEKDSLFFVFFVCFYIYIQLRKRAREEEVVEEKKAKNGRERERRTTRGRRI